MVAQVIGYFLECIVGMAKQRQIISKVQVRQPAFSPLNANVCPSDSLPEQQE